MVMFRALAKGILATLFVLSLPTLATAGVPANLTGTVFDDLDLDGNLDPGEPGVGAVTVNLDFGADGTIDSTQLTAGGGTFGFVATAPGTYRVRIVPPAGTAQTSANPPDLVIATAGGGLVANFGLGPVPSVLEVPTLGTSGTLAFLAALVTAAWIALRQRNQPARR